MKKKKLILIILVFIIIVGIIFAILKAGNNKSKEENKLQIVSSNFASYDFLRAIIGDTNDVNLTFLLGAGKDTHSYDPTTQDIISIQNADLFVYLGGETEKWADKVLDALKNDNTKVICISDYVQKIEEKDIDGVEEKEENEKSAFDDHIWTSPSNAIKMVNILEEEMEKIDNKNSSKYKENAEKYVSQIKDVDMQIQNIVDNRVRDRLIFADKMPMQYFIDYYNLKVSAAFNGCSTETEPSASTIAYLISKSKEEEIPVILYIELNTGRVAKIIADEVGNGCETLQIQTLHNVSIEDFNNGETWVSLMTRNIEVLKKALQ